MSLIAKGFQVTRPLLYRLDAEQAHGLSLAALKVMPRLKRPADPPELVINAFGLRFGNPLGLAAGFDKNGEVPDAMLSLGFGFVEAGTVTPQPQEGNPKPRLFRLSEDQAVINRMGFNNGGHAALLRRLARRRASGIVGVNIGANKVTVDRIEDYVNGVLAFGGIADYLVVNISSPNTPGLRGLQSRDELQALLARLNGARAKLARPVPMLIKIAPDLTDEELADIAACVLGQADGVIISNTTITRPALKSGQASEIGGLSGKPLFGLSTQKLAQFYMLTNGLIPLVGVGGICDGRTAFAKICAGASLLQLYSALVFHGPALIPRILLELSHLLRENGFASLQDAVGSHAAAMAYHKGPLT